MTLKINEMYFFGTRTHMRNNQIGLYSFHISAEFKTGINFITGGLHECGPGLSYTLCKGRLSENEYNVDKVGKDGHCKEFCLDDEIITLKQLQQMTYFITGEDKHNWLTKNYYGKTVMQNLKIAEKNRGVDINEIIDTFDLDERVHRNIGRLSGNRYRYSTAIGIAYGKKILCYPWLSCAEMPVDIFYSVLSKKAEDDNLIIIAPVEDAEHFKDKFLYNEIVANDLKLAYTSNGVVFLRDLMNDGILKKEIVKKGKLYYPIETKDEKNQSD